MSENVVKRMTCRVERKFKTKGRKGTEKKEKSGAQIELVKYFTAQIFCYLLKQMQINLHSEILQSLCQFMAAKPHHRAKARYMDISRNVILKDTYCM